MSKFSEALKKIQTRREDVPSKKARADTEPSPPSSQAKPLPSGISHNRRSEDRSKCLIQARAVISTTHEDNWINQASILNFSSQGLLFELDHALSFAEPLAGKATIRITIILDPKTKESIEVEGRVIRHTGGSRPLLAVRFNEDQSSLSKEMNIALNRKNA